MIGWSHGDGAGGWGNEVCVCEVGGSGPTVMVGCGFGSSGVITKQ